MNPSTLLLKLILAAVLIAPLSAGEINIEKRASLDGCRKIIIDQNKLRAFTIGINIMPVRTKISSWSGSDLAVNIRGDLSVGSTNEPSVTIDERNDSAEVLFSYRKSTHIGLAVGRLDIEILIPENWNSDLELKNIKTETSIEALSLNRLNGNMSMADLNLRNSKFNEIRLDLGTDSGFSAQAVDAGLWNLKGGMGDISADRVSGEMTIETFDGDIEIGFSRFEGASRLISGMGSIAVTVPDDSQLAFDLSSTTEPAVADLPNADLEESPKRGKIRGAAGVSENLLTARSVGGKVRLGRIVR